MNPQVASYLGEVQARLKLGPAQCARVLRELSTHIDDRVRELRLEGYPRDEAAERALADLGSPKAIARQIYEAHSQGSWQEAVLAAGPHLLLALLFATHLWTNITSVFFFLALAVAVTLYAVWHGKPSWFYTYLGYAMVPALVAMAIAWLAIVLGVRAAFTHDPAPLPVLAYVGLFVFIPLALWLLVKVFVWVIRRDWLYASLMLLPLPILLRLMLSLQPQGRLSITTRPALVGWESASALFLLLACIAGAFVRLRQRRLKALAIVMLAPVVFLLVWSTAGQGASQLSAVLLASFSALLFLSPLALEHPLGRPQLPWDAALLATAADDKA